MKTTFDKQYTEHLGKPTHSKKWFMDRVNTSIYSYQTNSGYFISNKGQAEDLFDNQEKGRRYKDLI